MSGENASRENVVENVEAKKDGADQQEKQFLGPDKVAFSSLCGRGHHPPVCYTGRRSGAG